MVKSSLFVESDESGTIAIHFRRGVGIAGFAPSAVTAHAADDCAAFRRAAAWFATEQRGSYTW